MSKVMPSAIVEFAYVNYFTVSPNVKTTINNVVTGVHSVRITYDLLDASKALIEQKSIVHTVASTGRDTIAQANAAIAAAFDGWVLADKAELSGYVPTN